MRALRYYFASRSSLKLSIPILQLEAQCLSDCSVMRPPRDQPSAAAAALASAPKAHTTDAAEGQGDSRLEPHRSLRGRRAAQLLPSVAASPASRSFAVAIACWRRRYARLSVALSRHPNQPATMSPLAGRERAPTKPQLASVSREGNEPPVSWCHVFRYKRVAGAGRA
eukprot:scaffold116878_cov63-Phaeocystis_antarctica.AAC.2